MTARRPSTMHTMQPLRPELFAIAPYPPWANPWPEQPGSRVLMLGATHQVRLHDLPMDPSLTLADLWDLAQRFPRPAHRNAVRSTRTLNEEIQDLDALRVGQCLSRPVEGGPEGPGYGQALHNVLRRLGTPETAEDLGPVLENQELILAMLLTQGCRPTIVNLAAAACSGNPRLVQRLLRANPDLRQTLGRPAPNVQKSPQGQLATFNDWSTVSETLNTLLDHGATLDLPPEAPRQNLLLQKALDAHNVRAVQALLAFGADPDRPDTLDQVPWVTAITSGQSGMMALLLAAGATLFPLRADGRIDDRVLTTAQAIAARAVLNHQGSTTGPPTGAQATLTLVQAEHARVEARLLRNDLDRLGIEPGMRDRRRL